MIDAIVFDLFETLVTETDVRPTRAGTLGPALGVDPDAFRQAWKREGRRVIVGRVSFAEALSGICRSLAGGVDTDAVRRACEQRQAEKDAVFARVNDDILHMLSELGRRHVAVGVISNCFEHDVRAWPASPLSSHVRCALFSFSEGVAKPDSEIYHRACRRLGSEPDRTLFIGDGGDNELAGAAEAGLHPFRAAWFSDSTGDDVRALMTPREVLMLAGSASA